MSNSGIYQIENRVNNRIYIGSSIDLNKRRKEHLYRLKNNRHTNNHLQNSFNKYGEKNFVFTILVYYESQELIFQEQKFLDYYKTYERGKGFNVRIKANSQLGLKMSEETKEKISIANTGRECSLETRRKLSEAGKNRIFSEDHRENLSKANKGREASQETKKKLSKIAKNRTRVFSFAGKRHSEESKKKIGESNRGKCMGNKHGLGNKSKTGMKNSEETRMKISLALKGKPSSMGFKGKSHTEETKRKISESVRRSKRRMT